MPANLSPNRFALLGCMLGAAALVALTQDEPFFWDTVQLGAMHGDWFYRQEFQTWLLPDRIDSGHLPAFGWYLAVAWQLFGQNLLVSHWAMWPWILLVAYQWWKLLGQTQRTWRLYWGMGLVIASPVVMSQLSLMSPDVILMGAFLLAWNSILDRQSALLTLAILLLGLTSMRGILVAAALYCWQLYRAWPSGYGKRWTYLGTTLLPYLPGGLMVVTYFAYHYWAKGWIVVHDDSPWAASFQVNRGWQTARQFIILAWRLIDFGYLFVWLGLLVLVWRTKRWTKTLKDTAVLLLILLLFLGIPVIMGSGLAQHRYLLPCFLSLSYLSWQLLNHYPSTRRIRRLVLLILIGLASGNLWFYPVGIAQGWDATLTHKLFFRLDDKSKKILNEENILTFKISTAFPLLADQHYYWLNQDRSRKQSYQRSKLLSGELEYVLYSNVINEFDQTDVVALRTTCDTLYHDQLLGVIYTLYDCR